VQVAPLLPSESGVVAESTACHSQRSGTLQLAASGEIGGGYDS
jgi:hypothetical protein